MLLLAFFAFPETAYIRDRSSINRHTTPGLLESEKNEISASTSDVERAPSPHAPKQSYVQSLKIFHKSLTTESLFKLIVRPLGLICLPPVLWSALVESVTIGFLVAVTSNIEVAYEKTYHFESWQVGLCFIAAILGSLLGIPAGGQLGDKIADWLTKRNGGIRDPEMRLPAMIPCLIATPLSLILFGVGIQHKLHWMCPTIGLALREFDLFPNSFCIWLHLSNIHVNKQ